MKKIKNLAIVGATGLVGRTFLKVIEERDLPIENLHLFTSERSAGTALTFRGKTYITQTATPESFAGIDIALFSAGKKASLVLAPHAAAGGCIVIDNSSAWRMHPNAPLVVADVNDSALADHLGIIGNPNCSTMQMVVALKPIRDNFGLARVSVSTYQSISGAGQKGISQLESELKGEKPAKRISEYQLKDNLIFHDFDPGCDYTEEEVKMRNETRRILALDKLKINATCVRLPIIGAHGESVSFETEKPCTPESIREAMALQPGLIVIDDPAKNLYPTITVAHGRDDVFVGRIRTDESIENGCCMWVVADNVRKGAATNAVQIAERLLRDDQLSYDTEKAKRVFLQV
jgi:aspartate-semialdehyde dehydrogenase